MKLERINEIHLMTTGGIWNPGFYAYVKSEEIIMDWEGSITYKQDRIQFMLEDVELDQSVVSSEIFSSTETKMIDNLIELHEHVCIKMIRIHLCMLQLQMSLTM